MYKTSKQYEKAIAKLTATHEQMVKTVIKLRNEIWGHYKYEEDRYGTQYADQMQEIRLADLNAILQPIVTIVDTQKAEKLKENNNG
jgi:hypothetical protein